MWPFAAFISLKTKKQKKQEKRWTKGHRRQGHGETKPKKHTSRDVEGKVKFKNTRAPARAQTRQEGALVRIGGGWREGENKIERDSREGVEKIAFQNYWPTSNNLYPHAVLGSSWRQQSLERGGGGLWVCVCLQERTHCVEKRGNRK